VTASRWTRKVGSIRSRRRIVPIDISGVQVPGKKADAGHANKWANGFQLSVRIVTPELL